jgi:two-component sensor histidine kinase
MVASEKAQPVAMALHELVTNAVKYGALSGSQGRLDVSWKTAADGKLEIDWLEENVGPDADLKNELWGFGTKLLELTISGQLGGRISRQISAGNLHCRLEVPV